MQILIHLIVSTLAVVVAAYVVPGVHVESFLDAFIVAVVLGISNAILRPILLFLTLPITLITLGLFTFVINALLVLLTDWLVTGFTVDNFWWAMLFSIVLSIINAFLHSLTRSK